MNVIYKILGCLMLFIMPQITSAQNTQWITPKCNNNIYSTGLTIEKVDFYSDATIVKLKYDNNYGRAGWIQLSRACKLKAYPSGQTYTLISAEGIPYAPTKHHFSSEKETLTFTCRFPAVPAGTTSIDWIEEDNWVIRNIKSTYETSVSHSAGRKFVSNDKSEKQTWHFPDYRSSSDNLKLQRVDIESDRTILWFKYTNRYSAGGWCSLDKNAKIIAYPSNKTLYLTKKTDAIPFGPEKHYFKKYGEELLFNLFFPALPAGTTRIDFIESSDSEWKMYDIRNSNNASSSSNNREPQTVTVGKSISTPYHTWTLKQIDLTSSKTVCRWSVTPKQRDTYVQMTQGVYLIDNKGKKYYMLSCDGISLAPKQDPIYSIRTVDYTVTFPAIDAEATSLTYYSSSSFQITDIAVGNNQAFSYGGSNTQSSLSNGSVNFNVAKNMSFVAYASSFCYPTGNGEWSEFSEWKNCDFEIEYNASNKQFIFHTAKVQRYKVEDYDNSDPSVTSFECRDDKNISCGINFVTLPDDGGNQIYLRFEDEQLCYAVRPGSISRVNELTTIPTQGAQGRVLPEVMNYPSYSKSFSNQSMTLTKVVANNSQTVLDFEYVYSDNQSGGIWLSPKTCIKAYPSGYKYTVTKVEGIDQSSNGANEQHYKGEKTVFRAYFPALPANTTHFDFMEEGETSDWVLCGISNSTQYKKDFLLLNSTYDNHNVNWEWYGGSKTFYVATTATDYDIIGLPSWVKVSQKVEAGFKIECQSGGEEYSSDYFIVRAKGQEVRVNVTRKKYNEYTSPSASFAGLTVNHYSYTKKITVTPNVTLKNMNGKTCSLCAFLLDPNGDVVNDVSETVKEFTPPSSNYSLSNSTITIDYNSLNINSLSGYKVFCALYDNEGQGYFSISDKKTVIKKSRTDIASQIRTWGKCRLVAITESNGDVAINGGNGYTYNGIPSGLLKDIDEIRDKKEVIQDITLTERGEHVVIWGNNGIRLSNIPNGMYDALKNMNSSKETITSAVFNDNGDWIVISEEHYNASSQEILSLIQEGAKQYGHVYSACLTNEAMIIVYDKGYKFRGNVPESLRKALNEAKIDVYRIKIAGDSWFFADKEGNYRMSL